MQDRKQDKHAERIGRVIDYLGAHLDEEISVELEKALIQWQAIRDDSALTELEMAKELAFTMDDARLAPLREAAQRLEATLVVGAPARRSGTRAASSEDWRSRPAFRPDA